MTLTRTKNWHQSTTIWAGYATMFIGLLAGFGLVIDISEAEIQEIMGAAGLLISGVATIRGRYKANSRID